MVNITLSIRPSFAWQSAKFWQDANGRAAILSRFWLHVNRAKAKGAECWPWVGATNGRGYGLFTITGRQRIRAHRLAWLIARGDIPKGQEVCHHCDNPRCVNPDHLYLATHRDNLQDAIRKGRKRTWGLQKLNASQVREIRARAADGQVHRSIAHSFGIAPNTVSQIVSRKTWAHLDHELSVRRSVRRG